MRGRCSVRLGANAGRSADGVSLNHVITTDSYGLNPFTANPFTANPFTANPFTANPFTANAPRCRHRQLWGTRLRRSPARHLPAAPTSPPMQKAPLSRCSTPAWARTPGSTAVRASIQRCRTETPSASCKPATDPEVYPSLSVPLDGIFDDASGHGTFIAGVIRQECPDARILPVRVADGEGIILETDLIGALEPADRHTRKVQPVRRSPTCLSASITRLRTTLLRFRRITELLEETAGRLRRRRGLLGRKRGDRPADVSRLGCRTRARSTSPWEHSIRRTTPSPSSRTSETGSTCTRRASRSSRRFRSTSMAAFRQAHATTRMDADETLDVDDFRGGYGVWSGTSFAAPVVAGRIAARIAEGNTSTDAVISAIGELESRDHSR